MDITHRQQIRIWIRETLSILGETALENKISVEYNNDFTRRMGDASRDRLAKTYKVRFSIPLWPLATEAQRRETVIHEICHVVDMARGTFHSSEAHGHAWGQLMIQCGLAPKRCHNVNRPAELRNKVQRFEAKCACMTHQITSHKRTKMLANTMRYRCLKCGTPVSLVQ